MREYYFERLEVWKARRSFIKEIYLVTNHFPSEEKFGLISQIRRASMSIAANTAEGMSRKTEKDKARFINQAFSSAIEVMSFLILSNDLQFLKHEEYVQLREKLEKITNQLNSLYNKFER
ncbi:30S ribosomal protein S23 [Mangrovimonas yunxiaonensis]|uniref:30S ribosomal protein S23 n=1 Tax=Mangrovimonas yunxiaonensis TaxID=1197477 RepID=A0A084TLS5_9FLAO|nr:four helix bundle protein [Mangrovimonas yunxiaonensis]KFB01661.1 30S ribosomal protein S23 [Mangrovimonas yunxiaonensis]GGH35370.1 four helix bundle protein [Mangrovimonas yunxiaonensis]